MDLRAQNNGHSWLDCEARGLKHQLKAPQPVLRGHGDLRLNKGKPSTSRQCKRCPVRILSVPR
jgi:hypothetical protein